MNADETGGRRPRTAWLGSPEALHVDAGRAEARFSRWIDTAHGVRADRIGPPAFSHALVQARFVVVRTIEQVVEHERAASTEPDIGTTYDDVAEISVPVADPPAKGSWTLMRAGSLTQSDCVGCRGIGSTPCPTCRGTARVTCKVCNSAGVVHCPPTVPCRTCGGKGTIGGSAMPLDQARSRCPTCHGHGETRCKTCGGAGAIRCSCDGGQVDCGCGDGQRVCKRCTGSGSRFTWTEAIVTHRVDAPKPIEHLPLTPRGVFHAGGIYVDVWHGQDDHPATAAAPDQFLTASHALLAARPDGTVSERAELEFAPAAAIEWGDGKRAVVHGTAELVHAPGARRSHLAIADWARATSWRTRATIIVTAILVVAVAVAIAVSLQ